MEKPPQEANIEKIDSEIENLLEEENVLFGKYIELYGEPGEALEENEYWIVQEANVGKDREAAKKKLEEFTAWLKNKISEKETPQADKE